MMMPSDKKSTYLADSDFIQLSFSTLLPAGKFPLEAT